MFCKCGKEISDDFKVCPECGVAIEEKKEETAENTAPVEEEKKEEGANNDPPIESEK